VTAIAANTLASLAPGDKLDRYELLCPIAEGGMARVWVARLRGKHGFEKLVAVKTILPRFAGDPRFREMFVDEASIASRIEHPNVAEIFDLGEERDLLYLVMEYVDGDALSKLNRTCQKKGVHIPAGIVLRVLADACAGLHEAHELRGDAGEPLGIVHRDVSPHNVLISTKGVAKLIDFGIAKAGPPDDGNRESGVLKGKIQYMAPEQALGRPVDRRADTWAVGAILYHLLAGKGPYEGGNQLATLHLLGSGVPPPPLPREVHPAIAAVVRKALAHEAAKRYATAADLCDAIERAMGIGQVTTTQRDVSAFSMQHLAERVHRRREAIERALAAAADRARAAGARAAATLSRDIAPTISELPPGASSYATIGSAALDAPRPTGFAAKAAARRSAVSMVALAVGCAAVTAASLAWVHPRRLGPPPPVAAAAGGVGTAATPPSATAAALPAESSSADSGAPAAPPAKTPKVDVSATAAITPAAPLERKKKKPKADD
jgi:eukaryotic-like serine/threonine-protein kinase